MALPASLPDLVLIGGQIAVGKTSVAAALADISDANVVRVRNVLSSVLGVSADDRARLQSEGARLDHSSGGRWLLEYLNEHCSTGRWIVDSARTRQQVEPILEAKAGSRLVYLDAHESTRRSRYVRAAQDDQLKRSLTFDEAMRHATEQDVRAISAMAHFRIDTDDIAPQELAASIAGWCGWVATE